VPEIRIGEIVKAEEVEIGGERRIVIEAKITGDVGRFLKELEEHGLTIFLTEDEPVCGVLGRPQEETLACQLKKGHKGAYHKNGRLRWIGYHVEEEPVVRES
jgi:hypothetical protein